ncbi:MAG: slipin family protein [Chloroflexota bacterium]
MDALISLLVVVGILFFVFVPLLSAAIKIVQEYERGVIFRLGRLVGAKGPGLFLIIPFIDRMVKVDLRTVTMDIPPQEVITKDNVTVKVNAVVYFRVLEPTMAVVKVLDYMRATSWIAQTTLRSVLGQSELDTLLSEREAINARLQQIIDEQTEPWGVKVSVVEVKDVELPQSMQRAMARQAEAEREKRAKVIHAEGELQASRALTEAATVIASEPITLQLRYLQTLTEISAEKNSTIIFPVPIDLLKGLLNFNGAATVEHEKRR